MTSPELPEPFAPLPDPPDGWSEEDKAYIRQCRSDPSAWEANEARYRDWRESVLTFTRLEDVNGGEAGLRATWNVLESRTLPKPTPAEKGALSLYADGYVKGYAAGQDDRLKEYLRGRSDAYEFAYQHARELRAELEKCKPRTPFALALVFGAGFAIAAVLALLGVL